MGRGRIGRYEVVTPLGTGGMAQVLVARARGPEGLGRLVALKRILPHLSTDPLIVQQFLDGFVAPPVSVQGVNRCCCMLSSHASRPSCRHQAGGHS